MNIYTVSLLASLFFTETALAAQVYVPIPLPDDCSTTASFRKNHKSYFKKADLDRSTLRGWAADAEMKGLKGIFASLTSAEISKVSELGACRIFRYSRPKAEAFSSANIDLNCFTDLFNLNADVSIPANWINKLNFGKISKDDQIMLHLAEYIMRNRYTPHVFGLDPKVYKALFKNSEAVGALKVNVILSQVTSKEKAKLFSSSLFAQLDLTRQVDQFLGPFIANLPDDIFSKVTGPIHESWFKHMTPEQAKNFQSKTSEKCVLRLDCLGSQAISVLPAKLVARAIVATEDSAELRSPKFWKRVNPDVFKKLLKDGNLAKIDQKLYQFMNEAQRKAIIEALAHDEQCDLLPVTILKGKSKYYKNLKIDKKCFKSMKADSGLRFKAIKYGLVEPVAAKSLEAEEIKAFHSKLIFSKKDDPFEVNGLCALEPLMDLPNGHEYIKALLNKDDDKTKEICSAIDTSELKKTKWLQQHLNCACIKNIDGLNSMGEVKKMDKNIWAGLSWKQLGDIMSGEKWTAINDSHYAGLGKNASLAKHAFEKSEKSEDDNGNITYHKTVFAKLPEDMVKAHFGADFFSAVPEEYRSDLIANLHKLHDSALAKSNGAFIRAHINLTNLNDGIYGHASDDLPEVESFAATVTPVEARGLTTSRVAALSSHFVAHMRPESLASFSSEQVKAITPESLVLVCGKKAESLKGLSTAQTAMLGTQCPATSHGFAPCSFPSQNLLVLAAAAASSAALLL